MKAITIKQPLAQLIVDGIKDIENRTWKTKFRGRVLVHAGIAIDNDAADTISYFDGFLARQIWFKVNDKDYKIGAIIGSVEIVDCVINHHSIWAEKTKVFSDEDGFPSYGKKTYNWVLANPILFPEPIPAKGKLSFWDYPNILAEPEEKNGELFCHCQLPVKELNQVYSLIDHFRCNYCGGRWCK